MEEEAGTAAGAYLLDPDREDRKRTNVATQQTSCTVSTASSYDALMLAVTAF